MKTIIYLLLAFFAAHLTFLHAGDEKFATYSIVAYDPLNGDLAVRLLAALDAGEKAGGDRRGSQSSALMVYREGGGYAGYNERFIDLRVEDHTDPVGDIEAAIEVFQNALKKFPDDRQIGIRLRELQKE